MRRANVVRAAEAELRFSSRTCKHPAGAWGASGRRDDRTFDQAGSGRGKRRPPCGASVGAAGRGPRASTRTGAAPHHPQPAPTRRRGGGRRIPLLGDQESHSSPPADRGRAVEVQSAAKADGRPACALVLDPDLVRIRPRAHRPFQGWRYLRPEDAPPDGHTGSGGVDALPSEMAEELRRLGLL